MKVKLGLGTVITFALILLVGGVMIFRSMQMSRRPPIIERQVIGETTGIAPVPEFLLGHTVLLQLSAEQQQRIRDLASAYRSEIAGSKKKLTAAADAYQRYLEKYAKSGTVNPDDLQKAGTEVRRLSIVVATTRHAYWAQARALLSPSQQRKIDAMLHNATAKDLQ